MSEIYENLQKLVNEVQPDLEKAERGNKSAAVRVRKAMQDIKKVAQDLRKEMMDIKKGEATQETC